MSGPDWSRLVPVNVVTGFLGSGKTTLLRRLLASPRLASCAVLVNEFGEVGLDHHLLEPVTGSMVLLDNGCVCCAVRDDLRSALLELHGRRERGEVPRYDRVVIESSGLADPAPIVHTLTADPVLRHHYRPGAVVTVVDALHGSAQLDRYPESVKQAALADRMVLTKTDLAELEASRILERRLRAMNPAAPIRRAAAPAEGGSADGGAKDGAFDAVALLMDDAHRPDARQTEAERWLGLDHGSTEGGPTEGGSTEGGSTEGCAPEGAIARPGVTAEAGEAPASTASAAGGGGLAPAEHPPHDHTDDVTSFRIETEEPVDWTVFGIWLGMLLHRYGEDILRVKGIVDVPELDGPVLLNAVQHTVHPPTHLPAWPRTWERDAEGGAPRRGTRIVFIVRGLERERIERSLAAFRDSLGGAPSSRRIDVPCAGAEPPAPRPRPMS